MQELEFIMGFRLEDKIKFHISDYIKIKNEIFKLNGRSLYPKDLYQVFISIIRILICIETQRKEYS